VNFSDPRQAGTKPARLTPVGRGLQRLTQRNTKEKSQNNRFVKQPLEKQNGYQFFLNMIFNYVDINKPYLTWLKVNYHAENLLVKQLPE
jgi:hypothetical protein